uniref:37S ribosomal protein S9, mitochondrial n=1 Tax=Panagrellus redivivus TaxID=6233 RepID=A0A7E4W0J4_PANRE
MSSTRPTLALLTRSLQNLRVSPVQALQCQDLSTAAPQSSQPQKLKSVGRALENYLRNARNYEKMLAKEKAEFELGKRYLANIMGWDATSITQDDVDKAIEYLFPSGLTDLKARPVMKPPEEILPKFHKFEFDREGKPMDPLFFTLKPKFYGLLSEVGRKTQHLVRHYDAQVSRGAVPESEPLSLAGSAWISDVDLGRRLGENISPEMYAQLVIALDYLASLPLAIEVKDFIFQYRQAVVAGSNQAVLFGPPIPEVQIDPASNRRMASVVTRAKAVKVEVTVRDAGTGKYTVDGHHYDVFRSVMARENLASPLIATNMFGRVDIEAKVLEGPYGLSIVPRAVRHGVSLGIAALFPDAVEPLRQLKMLTMEPRRKERSKVNQPGARAKWIWKRR